MRKSEIFEAFAKKMEEQEKVNSDKTKELLEKNPRMAALTADDIEKLYNVKPETAKGMEYKHNIMERAHEGNVVVSPSYDKLNGLVENNIERQNIMLHIVNKQNNGQSYNHKYAEQDLVLSLVSLGNHLDNVNKDELRTLADTCLMQITAKKTLTKNAALPALALWAIPALLGTIVVQQKLPDFDEGFEQNHNRLVSELDDFLNSNSNFGVGTSYTDNFKTVVGNFKSKLESFFQIYKKFKSIIDNFEAPKNGKELYQAANEPKNMQAVEAYGALDKLFKVEILPLIKAIQKNFTSESYKARQVEDKGFFTSLIDKTQVLHGKTGLINDDFEDVINAIAPYEKSVKDILGVFNAAQDMAGKAKADLDEVSVEAAQYTPQEASVKAIDDEAGGLMQEMEELSKKLPGLG